jgi:hypothetical protein
LYVLYFIVKRNNKLYNGTVLLQPVNYVNQNCCVQVDRDYYSRSQKVLQALTII